MPEFCVEKAKWLWEKGYNDEAISLLEREMQVHFSDVVKLKTDTSEQAKAKRRVCAQVCLFCMRPSLKMFVWHCLPRVSLGGSVGRQFFFF